MTRWSKKDLTGILLDNQKKVKGDQWEVVSFPAIMDHGTEKKKSSEYWKLEGVPFECNTTDWKMERAVDAKANF